jgi:hypothetical protein
MTSYASSNGNSGVTGYEIRDNAILIEFRHGGKYLYDYDTTGSEHVEEMKSRAVEGHGLASYINKHVRDRYAEKC